MRQLVVLLSLLLAASPLAAQDPQVSRIDKRVNKLESEMRAVQRKVFPGADPRFFDPEIVAPEATAPAVGNPASAPLTDLADRVAELERQQRTLTGQIEAAEFKLRTLEETQSRQRADVEFRLGALEARNAPPVAPPTPEPTAEAAPPRPVKAPAKAATAVAAWNLAYANVTARDWPATEAAMTAYAADWPKSTRLPQAQYWLGRSHAERDEHAEAARSFLKVYESAPRSAQAPDSLIGLSEAMIGLKKPRDACRVLGELDSVYGEKLGDQQKADATALRKRAKCAA